jgi:hypothetical protein
MPLSAETPAPVKTTTCFAFWRVTTNSGGIVLVEFEFMDIGDLW